METVRLLIRLSRPLFLLGGVLVYALGAGIAHYLGTVIRWDIYLLGQAWGTTLQLATQYLNEYYDFAYDADNANRTPFTGGSGALGEGKLPRRTALMAGLGCLAVVASLTVMILAVAHPSPTVVLIMVLIFAGSFFYSIPPVRLATSGYGELTTSIIVANLAPALAFLLQRNDWHRLLAMSTFPLTFIHMAMMLAFELPDYASDLKLQKRTLMVRLGWQRSMNLHNYLVLGAYFLLGLAVAFGMPFYIALPAFLTLPLGLLQIWQVHRIATGSKPNWTALTMAAIILFAGTTYLLAYAYWTR
jgi:1,4-dihydroxy-2-naphthoate octaprenyltransferase